MNEVTRLEEGLFKHNTFGTVPNVKGHRWIACSLCRFQEGDEECLEVGYVQIIAFNGAVQSCTAMDIAVRLHIFGFLYPRVTVRMVVSQQHSFLPLHQSLDVLRHRRVVYQ